MLPVPALRSMNEELPRYFFDAGLLFRRMALRQIGRTELAEADPLLFRELQALCTLCPSKEQCALDLEVDGGSDGWRTYCPNAAAFAALEAQQDCGLAAQYGVGEARIVMTKLGETTLRPNANTRERA